MSRKKLSDAQKQLNALAKKRERKRNIRLNRIYKKCMDLLERHQLFIIIDRNPFFHGAVCKRHFLGRLVVDAFYGQRVERFCNLDQFRMFCEDNQIPYQWPSEKSRSQLEAVIRQEKQVKEWMKTQSLAEVENLDRDKRKATKKNAQDRLKRLRDKAKNQERDKRKATKKNAQDRLKRLRHSQDPSDIKLQKALDQIEFRKLI